VALKKSDKAGLITFQDRIGTMLPASRQNNQMFQILEVLYNQKTAYRENGLFRSLCARATQSDPAQPAVAFHQLRIHPRPPPPVALFETIGAAAFVGGDLFLRTRK